MSKSHLVNEEILNVHLKRVATSENGWTDDEIGFEWYKQIFVPQAAEQNWIETEKERLVAADALEN